MSARPTRPRRPAVERPKSQVRMAAGLRSAGASTARGAPGDRHTVATDTETHASSPTVGRVGDGVGVRVPVSAPVPDWVEGTGEGVADVGVRPG